MGYCTYITKAGYELQAKLFAEGGDFQLTRVEVGRGVCPAGTEPSALTGLVEPMAQATSTKPRRVGCEVSLSVEYRSDLNEELEEAFQINEFGVFATGVDGSEILMLYGDLSDYPESAVPQKYGGCVRRYPVNITIGPDANASLAYPAGAWMTCEEVDEAIREGLSKGLSLEDGTTVGESLSGMREELDGIKESLETEDGTPVTETVGQLAERVEAMQKAVGSGPFYRLFEPEEWKNGELRIPAAEHGMAPKHPACVCTVRQWLARTAMEYDEATVIPVASVILGLVKAALAANVEAPGTYPTAEDGHVLLTWEQVQYALLESSSVEDEGQTVWNIVLIGAEEAAAKAAEEGFNWQERDNGVEPTATMDELLSAAYLPALGAPSASFEAMVTLQAVQGLRFRRGTGGSGRAAKYDLDGYFATTWGTVGCRTWWDPETRELVVSGGPFAGDLAVMGPADTGG